MLYYYNFRPINTILLSMNKNQNEKFNVNSCLKELRFKGLLILFFSESVTTFLYNFKKLLEIAPPLHFPTEQPSNSLHFSVISSLHQQSPKCNAKEALRKEICSNWYEIRARTELCLFGLASLRRVPPTGKCPRFYPFCRRKTRAFPRSRPSS